jgi:intermediate peptidase
MAQDTLNRTERLVDRILLPTQAGSRDIIKQFDTLSDMICVCIDMVAMLRQLHPSRSWIDASDEAYSVLDSLIHRLNVHSGLYQVLTQAELRQEWHSEEERRVAELLLSDFRKSGVHLSTDKRDAFVSKSHRINQLGHALSRADGIRENRRLRLLDEMVLERAHLAQQLGYASFAHMFLQDKMAETPERVMQFLKRQKQPMDTHIRVSPAKSMAPATVGVAMQWIAHLFYACYGVRIEPAPVGSHEVWHPSVRKLVVKNEKNESLGAIYCDLFDRRSSSIDFVPKCHEPVQFTARCSRRIDNDPEDAFLPEHYDDMQLQIDPISQHQYQLPVVVLSCAFRPAYHDRPSSLNHYEIKTLFHEMGHAIHAILARTDFQHVSGTRCKTDFVEVPSILMEHFANALIPVMTGDVVQPASSLERQQQLYFAALDQVLHSKEALRSDFSAAVVASQVGSMYLKRSEVPPMHYPHLFSYGAVYYSYLWCGALAERLFADSFRAPLELWLQSAVEEGRPPAGLATGSDDLRRAGQDFHEEILKYGGAVDPWNMRWDRLLRQDIRDILQ